MGEGYVGTTIKGTAGFSAFGLTPSSGTLTVSATDGFEVSVDGTTYGDATTITNDIPTDRMGVVLKDFRHDYTTPTQARYIKLQAHNTQHAFIFADEIVVR